MEALPAPGIAVVTHQSQAALAANLAGQAQLAERLSSPLVVVDNASTDGSVATARRLGGDNLRLIRSPRNLGYAAAVNRAAAEMPGRDLLLLNPDVSAPDDDTLAALTGLLSARPRAAVAAPRLLGTDGEAQPSARRFPSLAAMLGSVPSAQRLPPLRRSYGTYLAPSWTETSIAVDWVIGAAMLIRRAVFEELDGWDERFFLYMEDADFCRRCARAGWETWLVPSVSLRHGYARASTGAGASLVSAQARRRHIASLARFFAREPRLLAGLGRR